MTNLGKSIVGIIIIGLIVLGGYFYTRSTNSSEPTESASGTQTNSGTSPSTGTTTVQSTSSTPTGKKIAFSEFLKLGGSYTCTINQLVGETTSQGTVYINGDKVRGEFTTTVQGKDMEMSFLVLDGYTYMWSPMMQGMGFKMKNTSSESTASTQTGVPSGWSADQVGDYTCNPWTVDGSKFTVPQSIKFTAMGS